MIPCDGCASDTAPADIHPIVAEGVQARYCQDCAAQYTAWLGACLAEEGRLNALLSVFIAESRVHCPLRFVPQDLAEELTRRRAAAGSQQGIALG